MSPVRALMFHTSLLRRTRAAYRVGGVIPQGGDVLGGKHRLEVAPGTKFTLPMEFQEVSTIPEL